MLRDVTFVKSVFSSKELISSNLPEIVISGRSNVGKSSFINSITGKKGLAKVSTSPGKTRSINYYSLESKLYLVDLPGYGFAKAPKEEIDRWARLISEYFNTSKAIKTVFHLIDSRHEPTALDHKMKEMIQHYHYTHCVILTKADKLTQSGKAKAVKNIAQFNPLLHLNDSVFLYSSIDGSGKKEIIKKIKSFYT